MGPYRYLLLVLGLLFLFISCQQGKLSLDKIYPNPSLIIKYQDDYKRSTFFKRISEFKESPIGQNKVVFLGNSITNGLRRHFSKFNRSDVVNRGIDGDISLGILERLDEIIYYKPKAVFILIGLNDFFNDLTKMPEVTPKFVTKNIIKAANKIQRESPKTKIYLQTILPINTQQYQNKLKKDTGNSYYWLESDFEININEKILKTNEFLRNNKIFQVIDLHPLFIDKNNIMNEKYSTDGVHLNKFGYQKWIDNINPILNSIK
mgnify:CR=1 FL=1